MKTIKEDKYFYRSIYIGKDPFTGEVLKLLCQLYGKNCSQYFLALHHEKMKELNLGTYDDSIFSYDQKAIQKLRKESLSVRSKIFKK